MRIIRSNKNTWRGRSRTLSVQARVGIFHQALMESAKHPFAPSPGEILKIVDRRVKRF